VYGECYSSFELNDYSLLTGSASYAYHYFTFDTTDVTDSFAYYKVYSNAIVGDSLTIQVGSQCFSSDSVSPVQQFTLQVSSYSNTLSFYVATGSVQYISVYAPGSSFALFTSFSVAPDLCQGDCSGAGTCNFLTKSCSCAEGFSGPSCDSTVESSSYDSDSSSIPPTSSSDDSTDDSYAIRAQNSMIMMMVSLGNALLFILVILAISTLIKVCKTVPCQRCATATTAMPINHPSSFAQYYYQPQPTGYGSVEHQPLIHSVAPTPAKSV